MCFIKNDQRLQIDSIISLADLGGYGVPLGEIENEDVADPDILLDI